MRVNPSRKLRLKRHSLAPKTLVRSPVHSARSVGKRCGQGRFSTETQAQFARMKVTPSLRAQSLAGIDRIADASAAEIAAESRIELGRTLLAVRTMHPRPLAAEMAPRPSDPNPLGRREAEQVEEDQVSRNPHAFDRGPLQRRADRDPIVAKQLSAPQFANVEMPIPTKAPVYNGMIAPRDSWMMPPPCNEMIPPGAPRVLATRFLVLARARGQAVLACLPRARRRLSPVSSMRWAL